MRIFGVFISSRISMLLTGVFVLLLLGSTSSLAQVTTSVDTTNIRIGEEIQYTITVEADSTDLVLFPEGQTFLPLEVIESYPVDTSFAQAKYRLIKKYGLTQFDSGRYQLPAQRVYVNDRAFTTDSALVAVNDVPVDTLKQKMFNIKPVIEVDSPPFNWWNLMYLLIPLLGGLAYWYYRRAQKQKEEAARVLPPYEEAMVALKTLDDRGLMSQNRAKEYYSRLTEIVKRYLDREIDDRALESTSSELIERLRMHKDAGNFEFDQATLRKLNDMLGRADLVKFARMQQMEGQANADRTLVEEVINETKEAIPEPTEEELMQTAAYQEQLRKKRRKKRLIYGVSSGAALAVISLVIVALVKGPETITDVVVDNVTKDLAMGRWIKSEYGSPAVILETPEVLVRQTQAGADSNGALAENRELFAAGDVRSFYVSVGSIKLAQTSDEVLAEAMEQALVELETNGASNMVVKRGQYETDQGIKGLKSYGEFTYTDPKGKEHSEPIQYEILLFAQQGALQQITMAYVANDEYTEGIKMRIERSVELEIAEGGTP